MQGWFYKSSMSMFGPRINWLLRQEPNSGIGPLMPILKVWLDSVFQCFKRSRKEIDSPSWSHDAKVGLGTCVGPPENKLWLSQAEQRCWQSCYIYIYSCRDMSSRCYFLILKNNSFLLKYYLKIIFFIFEVIIYNYINFPFLPLKSLINLSLLFS